MEKKKNKPQPAQPSSKKVKQQVKPTSMLLQILWVVLLILLMFPLLKQLKGSEKSVTATKVKNEFSFTSWFSSAFQKRAEENLKKTWTYKDALTQFNNDLDFKLFNKINVNGFVIGKEDYVFSMDYIKGYLGLDYKGEDTIAKKLKMVRALQDTLKKRNIDLVVVYAPDKSTFFPEYFSNKYNLKPGKTNLADFVRLSKEYGLNYIDMESWFLKMKPTMKYPLFPQYGHHWSFYGGCVAADSLIRYLSNLRQTQFPHWGWKNVYVLDSCRGRDDDIIKKANLSFKPKTFPMGYPNLEYEENSPNNHTRVLGVADSYYRDFLMNGTMQNVFGNGKFWYYYNKVYPESDYNLLEIWELDLKKEIESNRVIVLLAAGGSLGNFGWGFIEDTHLLYTNPKLFYERKQAQYNLNIYKKQIRSNPDKLEEAKSQSLHENEPIDSVITKMAREMMKENKMN